MRHRKRHISPTPQTRSSRSVKYRNSPVVEIDVSFQLDFGEERRRVGGGAFGQRLGQSFLDIVPVSLGEVGLELEER